MLRSLYSAASGMVAQQLNMDTIANNLANVNTHGFKKARAEFQDLLYAQVQPPVGGESKGIAVGQGARLSGIHRLFSPGQAQVTGNPYDLAIHGAGFFRVRTADGSEAYTRDGSFKLDDQGRMVTANGDLLLGENGPITIPAKAKNVEVTADGVVRYVDPELTDGAPAVVAERILLATFANPAGLEAAGNNLWRETAASGRPALATPGDRGAGVVAQNQLEGSNVQVVEEMVSLIVAQRAYEVNSKVVQSADEMMALANNLRRG